ncbi:unnamed protein product [Sphenostylis stenocarpa]|uniref:Uncharacterized protein n=1 Tax=Sphenostylis stenocarpa TaxID=92480 RepID=A0AA86VMV3_9FABA|nr:unnamed protein product [Sphenostylis stenocarpa]
MGHFGGTHLEKIELKRDPPARCAGSHNRRKSKNESDEVCWDSRVCPEDMEV